MRELLGTMTLDRIRKFESSTIMELGRIKSLYHEIDLDFKTYSVFIFHGGQFCKYAMKKVCMKFTVCFVVVESRGCDFCESSC